MDRQDIFWRIVLVVLLAPLPIGAWALGHATIGWWQQGRTAVVAARETAAPPRVQLSAGMVRIAGGAASIGGNRHAPADQLPAHEVSLDSFWIDQQPVTNDQFEAFIDATGYVTTAEQRGLSLVFDMDRGRWLEVDGAHWREPRGARSSLVARGEFPVVHVSWHDAERYADWAGKRLLTEAEFEYAARGGLIDTHYAWGNQTPTTEQPLANYWQGRFPADDLGLDGYQSLAPVAQFPPNRWGLYDMAGNVWCWCGDRYGADYYATGRPSANPKGPPSGNDRVFRGGSWLSTTGTSDELTLAARGHAPPSHTAGNVGFRCASGAKPSSTHAEMAKTYRGAPRR